LKDPDQNQHTLNQIGNKLTNYKLEIKKLLGSLELFKEFIPTEASQVLKDLELKTEQLIDKMEGYNRAFKLAKTVRSEYLTNVERVNYWINDTEEKLKSHYTEPLEYKVSIHNCCQERPTVSEWFETARKNGQEIIQSTHDEHEINNIRQTVDQLQERLTHVFNLLEEQKTIIDNVVDAWCKFMELYQIIINWAAEKRIFVSQELKIHNQQEAQTRLSEYSVRPNAHIHTR
jgi:nesprin-1